MQQDEGRETGHGHPLPDSEEARHDEIPEHVEQEKGRGDDSKAQVQPAADPVSPDGERYELKREQEAHQDRGQSSIEDSGRD